MKTQISTTILATLTASTLTAQPTQAQMSPVEAKEALQTHCLMMSAASQLVPGYPQISFNKCVQGTMHRGVLQGGSKAKLNIVSAYRAGTLRTAADFSSLDNPGPEIPMCQFVAAVQADYPNARVFWRSDAPAIARYNACLSASVEDMLAMYYAWLRLVSDTALSATIWDNFAEVT